MKIVGRKHFLESLAEADISERYIGWLNDPETNRYLEVRHSPQDRSTVGRYIDSLRSTPGCELFAIKTVSERSHVGNIAITTFDVERGFATYGLLIGEKSPVAGAEATVLMVDHLLSFEGIHEIRVSMYLDNARAVALVEKIGFEKSGLSADGKIVLFVLREPQWHARRDAFRLFFASHSGAPGEMRLPQF